MKPKFCWINARCWLSLILGIATVACVAGTGGGGGPSHWPRSNPTVTISEGDYLDLQLRILGLELTQQSEGEKNYYFSFLPRVGRVEAVCVFKKAELALNDRASWEKRLSQEITAISAGVHDAIGDLHLAQGYDANFHLAIRFQVQTGSLQEIAVYRDGALHWLAP